MKHSPPRRLRYAAAALSVFTLLSAAPTAGADDNAPDVTPAEFAAVSSLVAESGMNADEALLLVRRSAEGNDVYQQLQAELGDEFAGGYVDVSSGVVSIATTEPASVEQATSDLELDDITQVNEVVVEHSLDETAALNNIVTEMAVTGNIPAASAADPLTGELTLTVSDEMTPSEEATVAAIESTVTALGGDLVVNEVPDDQLPQDATDTSNCKDHVCDWPAAGVKLKVTKNNISPYSDYDCTGGPLVRNDKPGQATTGHFFMVTAGHCVLHQGGVSNSPAITGNSNVPKDNRATWQAFLNNATQYMVGNSVPSSVNFYTSDYPIDYALYDTYGNPSGNVSLGLTTGMWEASSNGTYNATQPGWYNAYGASSSSTGAWLGYLAEIPAPGTIICQHGFEVYNRKGRQDCGYVGDQANLPTIRTGWNGYSYKRYWNGHTTPYSNSSGWTWYNVVTYMGDSGAPVTYIDSTGMLRLIGIVSTGSSNTGSYDPNGGWASMGMIRGVDMFNNLNANTGMNLIYYAHYCSYSPCAPGT